MPLANFQTWIQGILEWEDPGKSVTFLVVMGYIIYRYDISGAFMYSRGFFTTNPMLRCIQPCLSL